MKRCTNCGCEKPLSEFGKHKANPDGHQYWCRACKSAYYAANKDAVAAKHKAYYEANKERVLRRNKEWDAAHPEAVRAYKKKWEENNKEKVAAKTRRWTESNKERKEFTNKRWYRANVGRSHASAARYRAAKFSATPSWADPEKIAVEYELARWCAEVMGAEYHVDHIVPLQSKLVCGLHVEHNLRVIPGSENAAKANRHWPNMP